MSSISGFAFFDSRSDGNYDVITSAEISDTFVSLFTCTNEIIKTAKTDSSGHYLFENLYEGRYYIRATPPQWFAFSDTWDGKTGETTGELLNQEVDNDVHPDTGRTECFDLEEGGAETVSFALKLGIHSNIIPTSSAPGSAPMAAVVMISVLSPSAPPSKFAEFSSLEPSISEPSSSQLTPIESPAPPSADVTALPTVVQTPPNDNPEDGNLILYTVIAICGGVLVAASILLALWRRKKHREELMGPH